MSMTKREANKAATRLLKSGGASVRDILEVSYGEWPPRGIDVDAAAPTQQRVTLTTRFRELYARRQIFKLMNEKMGVLGRATLVGERKIWINRGLCRFDDGGPASTMGHEVVHTLQGDHFYRAAEIFGAETAQKIRSAGWTAPAANVAMYRLLQADAARKKPPLRRIFNARSRHLAYVSQGIETQAFLHQALTRGYRKWKRLPTTIEDFWQAMVGFGLKPPLEIRAQLDALPQEAPSRLFRSRVRGEPASNLRLINKSLSGEGRLAFWRGTLPFIYGDLLRMYGDKRGVTRFGFSAVP